MELLKKLCEAHGVPGREEAVRELVISELRGICDEIRTDALGNVIALKKGSGRGPKVMLAAHMDEIGFLVSHIDEKSGFLRIDPVGGFDPRVLMVGNLVSCKALDDRVGVYVMIEAVRRTKKHVCDIYAVATTQEEVGVRGARVSSFNVAPDIGVALDVTVASDVPGVGEHEQVTKLGAGVAIKIKDSLSISNPKLVRTMRQIAEQKNIKYQLEILPRGGTDAGAIQMTREGVAAITLSIPTRYLHSVVEAAHKDDIQAAIDLLAAFLEVAHESDYSL
jgi:putative aminopeptidase FrvX